MILDESHNVLAWLDMPVKRSEIEILQRMEQLKKQVEPFFPPGYILSELKTYAYSATSKILFLYLLKNHAFVNLTSDSSSHLRSRRDTSRSVNSAEGLKAIQNNSALRRLATPTSVPAQQEVEERRAKNRLLFCFLR